MNTAAITAKTVSAKQLAFRAAKREQQASTRAAKIIAKVVSNRFCAGDDEIKITDYAGRAVRQTKATDREIAYFLRGNRVVDTYDILEELGEQAFNNLVQNGTLVRDASFNRFKKNNLYWVSRKAVELYGLPTRIRLSTGVEVDYAA